MSCEEKKALLKAYEKANREHSEGLLALINAVGVVLYADFELLREKVAVAREASQQARRRLREHIDQHKC